MLCTCTAVHPSTKGCIVLQPSQHRVLHHAGVVSTAAHALIVVCPCAVQELVITDGQADIKSDDQVQRLRAGQCVLVRPAQADDGVVFKVSQTVDALLAGHADPLVVLGCPDWELIPDVGLGLDVAVLVVLFSTA